jgi:hypothetical protein
MRSDRITILDDPALASSRVITTVEAKTILKCGMTRLYELLGSGAIRSYKDGESRRIFLYSVLAYQAACAEQGPKLG